MSWIAAGSAVVSAGVGIFNGSKQKKMAEKQLASLNNPNYTIPTEVLENQKMAQMRANSGLPSAQYQKAQQDIRANRNAAIAANADKRGGVGVIGAIQGQSDDATNALNAADAQQKIANEKTLYGINQDVAGYKDKKWAAEKDTYDRDYNYAMSLKGVGNQSILNGIDSGLSGLIGANTAMQNNGGKLFGKSVTTQKLTPTSRVNGTNYYNGNTPTSKTYSKFQTTDYGEDTPTVATPTVVDNNVDNTPLVQNGIVPNYYRRKYKFN